MVCDSSVPSQYAPARSIDHKLSNKEFEEEDFYVSSPSRISITAQPTSGRPNKTLGAVQVAVLDGFGSTVLTDDGTEITLSATNLTGTLAGTLSGTRTVSNGVATFSDLKFIGTGNGTSRSALRATRPGRGAVERADYVASPASIKIIAQPVSGRVNRTLGTVKVAVLDGLGNTMVTDDGWDATKITLSGTKLSGSLTRTVSNGVATFSDLKYTGTGTFTFTASSNPAWGPSVTSVPITITP